MFPYFQWGYNLNGSHVQNLLDAILSLTILPIIFLTFIYFWERERAHKWKRGRERRRHRIQSRLHALSCHHRARHGADMTWAKVGHSTNWATQAPLFWLLLRLLLGIPNSTPWSSKETTSLIFLPKMPLSRKPTAKPLPWSKRMFLEITINTAITIIIK